MSNERERGEPGGGMPSSRAAQVSEVRAFNRFWTRQIGVLQAGLLDSQYSLTEARVLFELAQSDATDASMLRAELGLDAGYLSRILTGFKAGGLISAEPSDSDGRRQVLRLTDDGRKVFRDLDDRSAAEVSAMLDRLTGEDVRRLLAAMSTIEDVLGGGSPREPYVIRPLLPGDLGWVVHRHGVLYAQEHGWDETFEALVAEIVAGFGSHREPRRENAWIAERDGDPVGSIFCCKRDEGTAQLRLLLVEPRARGFGIGARLVDECVRFAKRAGYDRMVLWTNDVLVSARRLYEAAGFVLVEEEAHHSFGSDLVGQTWELDLRSRSA